MVYIKTYTFNHFYSQYLVLLTKVPRNSSAPLLRPRPFSFPCAPYPFVLVPGVMGSLARGGGRGGGAPRRNEGVRGLYRGIGAVLVGGIPATCLYLTTYEAAKEFLAGKLPGGATVGGGGRGGGGGGGIATHLTAGMLAEVVW